MINAHYIANQWQASTSLEDIPVIDPSSGVTVYSENFKGSRNQVRMLCLDRAIQILREHLA